MSSWDFYGKKVVITGASCGLGRALAIAFSKAGAEIALVSRNVQKMQETQSMLNQSSAHLFQTNLSNYKSVETTCQAISHTFSQVDILINNAAGWVKGSLEDTPPEEIYEVFSSTAMGSIFMAKYLLSSMEKSPSAHVINIISMLALPATSINTAASSTSYCAAKWGQAGFSEALRSELHHKKIKVTTLYPNLFEKDASLDDSEEDFPVELSNHTLNAWDVVEAVLFCASRSRQATVHSMVISGFKP